MALHHWTHTAYQDVGNAFSGDAMEDDIELAARKYHASDRSDATLTQLASKAYDELESRDKEDWKDEFKATHVRSKHGKEVIDDSDLAMVPWETVFEHYQAAYRAAAIPQVKKFILERHNQMEEDEEFEDEDASTSDKCRSDVLDLLEETLGEDDDLVDLCKDILKLAKRRTKGKDDGKADEATVEGLEIVEEQVGKQGGGDIVAYCSDLLELAEMRADEEDDDDEEAEEDDEEDEEGDEEGEDDVDEEEGDEEEDGEDEDGDE